MAKWELYLIVGVILIAAIIGAGAYERHVGYKEAEADMQERVNKANAKTDELQTKLQGLSDAQADRIEKLSTDHEAQLAAVSSTLRNRLCGPIAVPAQVPAPSGTSGVPAPAKPSPAISENTSDPRFLSEFVKACQHDADSVDGWNEWWVEQLAVLKSAFPELEPPK